TRCSQRTAQINAPEPSSGAFFVRATQPAPESPLSGAGAELLQALSFPPWRLGCVFVRRRVQNEGPSLWRKTLN
ncbi:hypothetical protein, partial [Oceanicaulis sp.]|uniref:hypothetical protein n=1 Tax=Oceanicaulis sp. TaxID=1924941 RepID=UPI003F6EF16E